MTTQENERDGKSLRNQEEVRREQKMRMKPFKKVDQLSNLNIDDTYSLLCGGLVEKAD